MTQPSLIQTEPLFIIDARNSSGRVFKQSDCIKSGHEKICHLQISECNACRTHKMHVFGSDLRYGSVELGEYLPQ